jgi:hypothetical protein
MFRIIPRIERTYQMSRCSWKELGMKYPRKGKTIATCKAKSSGESDEVGM